MTKPKDRSENEHLRGEIRRLKSENRNLRKSLQRANKQARRFAGSEFRDEPDVPGAGEVSAEVSKPEAWDLSGCPKCGRELNPPTDLGSRILVTCPGCKYRKSSAKEEE